MPGRPLGRLVEHDPRSLQFPAARAGGPLRSVQHRHYGAILDQGDLGGCVGYATVDLLMTAPYRLLCRRLVDKDAVNLYSLATTVDEFDGQYPPTDTGSSGLAAMKAAQQCGYISAYHHAFGLQHALEALVLGPVITGVNWYSSFDSPAADGRVAISPAAVVRGGHEFEIVGLDVTAQTVKALNSWGPGWGQKGTMYFSWADWDRLLSEDGDVTVAVA